MTRSCQCGASISARSKSGRCRPCNVRWLQSDPEICAKRAERRLSFNRSRRLERPRCAGCGIEVSLSSTRCRDCARALLGTDPDIRARASASLSARHKTDPEFHEQHRAKVKAAMDRAKQDPAFVAQRSAQGRRYGRINIELTRSPESRQRAGRTLSARRLAHVPAGYRDLYRDLTRKGLSAAERLQIVLDQARADEERAPRVVREAQQAALARHDRQQREAY